MKLKYMMCIAAVSMFVGQVAVGQILGENDELQKLPKVGGDIIEVKGSYQDGRVLPTPQDGASKQTPSSAQPPAESPNNGQLAPPPSPAPIVEGPPPAPKETH